jgi:cobalt-zinc-cadmium resistance protein CzcA
MLKSIIIFCLARRTVILFSTLFFLGAGLIAFKKFNIEAYPNPAPVIFEITAQSPGLSAEEMEKYYTIPIETGLYSVPGLSIVRSTSFYGLSFVRVVFKYGEDFRVAANNLNTAIQQNVILPNNQIPNVQESSTVGEIYRYTISGPENFGITNLRTIEDWVVAKRLLKISGIVQVNGWGGKTKQFDVEVNPLKLQAYNITIPQIITALGNSNINVGGREVRIGQQSVNIRGIGLIDSGGSDDLTKGYKTKDIENVVLTQVNGIPILVKDVAKVKVGFVPRLGILSKDNETDVVGGIVVLNRLQKTSEVLPLVKNEIEKINNDGSLPKGVKVVPFYDRTDLIKLSQNTVLNNLLMGCLLVFLIQWIFLGDLKSALIVSANIPFALLFATICLVYTGDSGNLLSIGAIDFGIIVDTSVILIENIFRNFQKRDHEKLVLINNLKHELFKTDQITQSRISSWSDRLKLILISSFQVDSALFISSIITIAGFIPLFTMSGVEGQIFGPMARTYIYALIGALISTFTITPIMVNYLFPKVIEEKETLIVTKLRSFYLPILEKALKNPKKIVIGGCLFLFFALLISLRLGTEFLPSLEENNYVIRASMPLTLSLEDGQAISKKMRDIVKAHPEVKTVTTQHGRPDNGSDAAPLSNIECFVFLKEPSQWPKGSTKEKLTKQLTSELNDQIPGVQFNFAQYIQDNVAEAISGVKGSNAVKIIGSNLKELERIADQVQKQLNEVKGITDLATLPVLGQPNLNIKIDRAKAARYGLNSGDINTIIQAALGGVNATSVLEGDRQFNLVVRYQTDYRDKIDKIKKINIKYTSNAGTIGYVPLSQLADISLSPGASFIYHEKNERYIPVKFSVRDRDLGSAVKEAQQRIQKNVILPAGYRLVWAGEFEDLQNAKNRLFIIVPISLVIILVILYSNLNSFKDCLFVLSGIPFAVAGGIIGLTLTGVNFSISAAVGFISIFGVSVKSGILLITSFRENLQKNMTAHDAMYQACEQRMRPLLMTTLAACIGLLPAAISTGIGSQVQQPLAVVIVSAMLIGPVMLLIVVPALQLLFLEKNVRIKS